MKQEGLHKGCRRNTFGIFDAAMIPAELHGEIPDLCIRCFESHDERIAARSGILSLLTKLTGVYPEIFDEIILLIQFQPQRLPPAIKIRVKHFEKQYGR